MKNQHRDFYTYLWLREDGTPYYVGKGTGRRAYRKSAPPPERIVIQYWPDEATAFAYEMYLIDFWGRKDLGTGILINLHDGGEGGGRSVWTDHQKQQQSLKLRGNKRSLGNRFHLTQEQRDKIAVANRLRKGERRSAKGRERMSEARSAFLASGSEKAEQAKNQCQRMGLANRKF
jgi:hypothetical protein